MGNYEGGELGIAVGKVRSNQRAQRATDHGKVEKNIEEKALLFFCYILLE